CNVAAPSVVPGRAIGQKRILQNLGLARLDAKCGMAVPCLFHRNCLLGNLSLYWKCKASSHLPTCTFHQPASASTPQAAVPRPRRSLQGARKINETLTANASAAPFQRQASADD